MQVLLHEKMFFIGITVYIQCVVSFREFRNSNNESVDEMCHCYEKLYDTHHYF